MYADRDKWNAWHRNRRRQIAYGRWNPQRPVDPTPVREHIAALRRYGLSEVTIARMSGHPTAGSLNDITNPNHSDYLQGITADRAARILAVRFDLDAIPANAQVDPSGTRRRIEALAYMGWPSTLIAEHLGVTIQAVRGYANPNRRRVSVKTARAIRDIFNQFWSIEGPSAHSANRARARGWHGPLAWDDIDNPDEQPKVGMLNRGAPDPIAVARLIAGERFDADRVDQITACAELTRRGMSAAEIADQLGLAQRTVVRWRARARAVAA